MPLPKPGKVTQRRGADDFNEVVTIQGGQSTFRKVVCRDCPWKKENAGGFPAQAFRHSAVTAEDASMHLFACHSTSRESEDGDEIASEICAGFLHSESAVDNLQLRLAMSAGRFDPDSLVEPTDELFPTYRQMAVANGVPEDDPAIAKTMPEGRDYFLRQAEARLAERREAASRG